MNRIFNRFEIWECYKYGLYDNSDKKDEQIKKVVELFTNPILTEKYMVLVTQLWTLMRY